MNETSEEGTRATMLWAKVCAILAVVLTVTIVIVMNLPAILHTLGYGG